MKNFIKKALKGMAVVSLIFTMYGCPEGIGFNTPEEGDFEEFVGEAEEIKDDIIKNLRKLGLYNKLTNLHGADRVYMNYYRPEQKDHTFWREAYEYPAATCNAYYPVGDGVGNKYWNPRFDIIFNANAPGLFKGDMYVYKQDILQFKLLQPLYELFPPAKTMEYKLIDLDTKLFKLNGVYFKYFDGGVYVFLIADIKMSKLSTFTIEQMYSYVSRCTYNKIDDIKEKSRVEIVFRFKKPSINQ